MAIWLTAKRNALTHHIAGPRPYPMGPSEAYKALDGLKIEGRRILVDVERGRTVKGWRPRRLGAWPTPC